MNIENDIPKHKKKTESTVSKSKRKSRHKHKYKECLLVAGKTRTPHHATYCEICGKIGNVKFWETAPIHEHALHAYRILTETEVFEKYKNLEQIYVDDVWQKYIPICREE